jgi:hypothetical protein
MKREEVFERLDPPPGGAAKLRARLDSHERHARRGRIAYVAVPAGVAVAAAVAFLVVTRPRVPDLVKAARARGGLDQVALGLSDSPPAAVAVTPERQATASVLAMRTENPNVAFYWVASAE